MILIRGLLDRAVLLLAVVAGGCVPSFVNQYLQRVGGRLDQVTLDLAPFQKIADRYHDGSMDALIQHHLSSSDPTFHAEGRAIQAMVDSAASLQQMLAALNTDIAHQLGYLVTHHDTMILNSTFRHFEPAFTFTPDALLVAASTGALVWLLFISFWMLLSRMGSKVLMSSVVSK